MLTVAYFQSLVTTKLRLKQVFSEFCRFYAYHEMYAIQTPKLFFFRFL